MIPCRSSDRTECAQRFPFIVQYSNIRRTWHFRCGPPSDLSRLVKYVGQSQLCTYSAGSRRSLTGWAAAAGRTSSTCHFGWINCSAPHQFDAPQMFSNSKRQKKLLASRRMNPASTSPRRRHARPSAPPASSLPFAGSGAGMPRQGIRTTLVSSTSSEARRTSSNITRPGWRLKKFLVEPGGFHSSMSGRDLAETWLTAARYLMTSLRRLRHK